MADADDRSSEGDEKKELDLDFATMIEWAMWGISTFRSQLQRPMAHTSSEYVTVSLFPLKKKIVTVSPCDD
jgi:hypothetical protein